MTNTELKNTRDIQFEESRFLHGNRNFRELSRQSPDELTKDEFIRCLVNCSSYGWLIDGPALSTRLNEISNTFESNELIELFDKCVDGASSVMIPNNTRVAGNLLEVASGIMRIAVQRSDTTPENIKSVVNDSLNDLYQSANDAAVENRNNPELALACLAISGWALDMQRGIIMKGLRNLPENAPSYYYAA